MKAAAEATESHLWYGRTSQDHRANAAACARTVTPRATSNFNPIVPSTSTLIPPLTPPLTSPTREQTYGIQLTLLSPASSTALVETRNSTSGVCLTSFSSPADSGAKTGLEHQVDGLEWTRESLSTSIQQSSGRQHEFFKLLRYPRNRRSESSSSSSSCRSFVSQIDRGRPAGRYRGIEGNRNNQEDVNRMIRHLDTGSPSRRATSPSLFDCSPFTPSSGYTTFQSSRRTEHRAVLTAAAPGDPNSEDDLDDPIDAAKRLDRLVVLSQELLDVSWQALDEGLQADDAGTHANGSGHREPKPRNTDFDRQDGLPQDQAANTTAHSNRSRWTSAFNVLGISATAPPLRSGITPTMTTPPRIRPHLTNPRMHSPTHSHGHSHSISSTLPSPRSSTSSSHPNSQAPSTPIARGEATQAASPTMATRTSFTSGARLADGSQDSERCKDEGSSARRRILVMLQGYRTSG